MTETLVSAQRYIPRLIDFTEINANNYDEWEQFSDCLLREMGYRVIVPPGRGPDGGRDMLAVRDGMGYVVSCKHYANSGRAVGMDDELNILERIKAAGASGFVGVYSSGASQALINRLTDLTSRGYISTFKLYQGYDIEQFLLSKGCSLLVRRYFPVSYFHSRMAARVFSDKIDLPCSVCGRDLLPAGQGWLMWAEVTKQGVDHIFDLGCACKGQCINVLESVLYARCSQPDLAVLSEEVCWCNNPLGYYARKSRIMNALRNGVLRYSDEAWRKEVEIDAALAQCAMREVTQDDREMLSFLMTCDETR